MNTRLGDHWKRIAFDLGIEVVAPFALELPDGTKIEVDVLIKHFGGPKGIVVVEDYSKIEALTDTILGMGYGFSSMAAPNRRDDLDLDEDLDSHIEVLSDWTWTGPPSQKPNWLREQFE